MTLEEINQWASETDNSYRRQVFKWLGDEVEADGGGTDRLEEISERMARVGIIQYGALSMQAASHEHAQLLLQSQLE